MLCNVLLKKNKKNSILYSLKYNLNKKYKKILKFNKYLKIYNPRHEINNYENLIIHKNKFYIN